MPPTAPPPSDPVRAKRAVAATWASRGKRLGTLLYGLACVGFVLGFLVGFTPAVVTFVVGALVVGSVLLAPAIVLGYAVNAAEREDRAQGV